jgi:site-specific DNA-adenine methylase
LKDPDFLREISATIYSEDNFIRASIALTDEDSPDYLRAWAIWFLCGASFAYEVGKGFGFNRAGLTGGSGISGAFYSRRDSVPRFAEILDRRNLTIFNRDFADLPEIYDEEGVLYYLDPPYIGTYLGHCGAWTVKDEIRLLRWASTFERAKIVISGYLNNEQKIEFAQANDWQILTLRAPLTAKKKGSHKKIEIVIRNF